MTRSREQIASQGKAGMSMPLSLPWWFRPSLFLLFTSLPAVLLLAASDSSLSQSEAELFYSHRDTVLGVVAILVLASAAFAAEAGLLDGIFFRKKNMSCNRLVEGTRFQGRIAEAFLDQKIDWLLMGIFVVSHLIFFRGFFLNPGLIAGVLGGNLELKHTFETIPGVTTWTQVSLLLGALRGLRWAGILPGKVKLISMFHIVFFGTLFVRAILWSERLALVEGAVPFFLCATPRMFRMAGPQMRFFLRVFPLLVPVLLLVVFTAFEFFRSWQSNAMEHGSILQFGWLRLYTYYFEAMNTGAATLDVAGFHGGLTMPMSMDIYDQVYEGLYQGSLDPEFNNTSGIWYLATRAGSLLFFPLLALFGLFYGLSWRAFREGRLLGLFFPVNFLGLMEIIRVHYWFGVTRVLPTTIFIVIILVWAALLPHRLRVRARQDDYSPPSFPGDDRPSLSHASLSQRTL